MKTCRKCNKTKPETDYYDSMKSTCKECFKVEQAPRNRQNNPKHNPNRMWVNGKYISKKHPLFKAGRYKTLDDAWSHVEIDQRSTEGEVYIIANKAFPNWYKVGKAVSAEDRLNGYQTSSPFRDYELLYSVKFDNRHRAESDVHKLLRNVLDEECCKSEWFKADYEVIKDMVDVTKASETQLDLLTGT